MIFEYFLKGFIIGLSVAAPVGAIGILCIKRSLTEGQLSGFVTGLGAAFADATYSLIAAFSLSVVSTFLIAQEVWIKIIGGSFMLYLGIKFFISKPPTVQSKENSKGLFNNFISTFFLTLTNPSTIISFVAIFAGLGIGSTTTDYLSATNLVVGVFIGSTIWWLFLSWGISLFKSKISAEKYSWINKISGIVIILFSLFIFYSLIKL